MPKYHWVKASQRLHYCGFILYQRWDGWQVLKIEALVLYSKHPTQQPTKNRITCKMRLCKGHLSVTQGRNCFAVACKTLQAIGQTDQSVQGEFARPLPLLPFWPWKKKKRHLLFPNTLIPGYSWIWRSRKTTSHLNPLTCDGSCHRGPSHPSSPLPPHPLTPLQILTQVRVAGPTMGPERRHSERHDTEISRFSSPPWLGG